MPEIDGGKKCYIADTKDHFSLLAGHVYFVPAYHEALFYLDENLKFLPYVIRPEAGDLAIVQSLHALREMNQFCSK